MDEKRRFNIPSSATNDDIELVASKLFTWGYTVRKGKYKDGEAKNIRFIEFYRED